MSILKVMLETLLNEANPGVKVFDKFTFQRSRFRVTLPLSLVPREFSRLIAADKLILFH